MEGRVGSPLVLFNMLKSFIKIYEIIVVFPIIILAKPTKIRSRESAYFCLVTPYNVLVVFPEPTKSHGILGDAYVRTLLAAGHHVTYITPFVDVDNARLTHVSVESNLKKSEEIYKKLKDDFGSGHKFLLMLGHKFARMSVEHPNVQNLLSQDLKFDVVIAEWIDSEIYSGFAAVFDCPLIWAVSTHLHWQPLRLMDNYPNPSYSADVNSGHVTPFTFGTRMYELWLQFMKTWILHFTIKPMEEEVYESYFKKPSNRSIEPYNEVSARYSMMFVYSHPTIGPALPVPASVQYIGGLHITPYSLPDNFEKIMRESTSGVVYFSFGTTEHTKDMSGDVKNRLLKLFGELTQTVIWKVDVDEQLDSVPPNVIVIPWAPQTALLAHPNMKLFISHCGLLSMMEAIAFGVPLVVIPRNGDQFTNAELAVKRGIAVKVLYSDTLVEHMSEAIHTVLTNNTYKLKANILGEAFRSRPVDPINDIKYWVAHTINMRGSYLRSAALDVPLYQRLYVDLVAIIFSIVLSILIAIGICCCCCCCRNRGSRRVM